MLYKIVIYTGKFGVFAFLISYSINKALLQSEMKQSKNVKIKRMKFLRKAQVENL